MAYKVLKNNNKILYWNQKQLKYNVRSAYVMPTEGLVAFYKFEQNINDTQGSYNLGNAPASYVTGKFDSYAANYTGQESNNVDLRNIFTGTNSFSISTWIKYSSFAGQRMIFGCDANNSSPYQRVWIVLTTGDLIKVERYNATNMGNIGSVGCTTVSTTLVGNNSTWNHIVLSYKNGDVNPIRIYTNNSLCTNDTGPSQYYSTNVGANTGFISAGPCNNNQNNVTPLTCVMDNTRIYNRYLTTDEVEALYNE